MKQAVQDCFAFIADNYSYCHSITPEALPIVTLLTTKLFQWKVLSTYTGLSIEEMQENSSTY